MNSEFIDLKGKRILLFSAQLFGYQLEIMKCMNRLGAVVDYYDERPGNSFWIKALLRINRNLLGLYTDKYYNHIIKQTRNIAYSYVFFTKGESISVSNLRKLKAFHPQAQFIIYHWDSIANNRNAQNLMPFFDKVFSFDKIDCEKNGIRFLPLFYIPDYVKIAKSKETMLYDLLFVGTAHSDRYELIKNIECQFERNGKKCYSFFFFPSKILFYKMKFQNPVFRSLSERMFHFKSMSKENLLYLFSVSRVIVDIQHPKQTGLTMRTIETLGAKRKMITTNQAVEEYDFYNPNNILIINRKDPVIPEEFLNSAYQEIPQETYNKYSIEQWLTTILS